MIKIFTGTALALAAAPLYAVPPPAGPVATANARLDDFTCMVRTMYMAGAAGRAAANAPDQAGRDSASKVSVTNYEAASFFIGKLSTGKPAVNAKQRFAAEVAGLSKLGEGVLADQIAQCVSRAQTERADYLNQLASK